MGQHMGLVDNKNDLCVINELVITGTIFPHEPCHKTDRDRPFTPRCQSKERCRFSPPQLKLKLASTKKRNDLKRRYDVGKLKLEDRRR